LEAQRILTPLPPKFPQLLGPGTNCELSLACWVFKEGAIEVPNMWMKFPEFNGLKAAPLRQNAAKVELCGESFSVRSHCVDLAFAVTMHKIQGRTLQDGAVICVDETGAKITSDAVFLDQTGAAVAVTDAVAALPLERSVLTYAAFLNHFIAVRADPGARAIQFKDSLGDYDSQKRAATP
jgi:hypothetical protein